MIRFLVAGIVCLSTIFGAIAQVPLPSLFNSQSSIVDFAVVRSTAQQRIEVRSNGRVGQDLELVHWELSPPNPLLKITVAGKRVTSGFDKVSVEIEASNPISTVQDLSAQVVLTFINRGAAFPDLALGAETQVTVNIRGWASCDPSSPTCTLNGPLCTLDVANEAHAEIRLGPLQASVSPAIRLHLTEHTAAVSQYQLPLNYLIEGLGLRSFITDDPTSCQLTCPCDCTQPQLTFTKPSSRSPQAVISYRADNELDFKGMIPGTLGAPDTMFVLHVEKSLEGFVTVGPSHSEFLFRGDHGPKLYVWTEDGAGNMRRELFSDEVSCSRFSDFNSIVRPHTLSPGLPGVSFLFRE